MKLSYDSKWVWVGERGQGGQGFVATHAQARRILFKNELYFRCECYKIAGHSKRWGGCFNGPQAIERHRDGSISIGCTIFTANELSKLARFLRRKKRAKR